MSLAVFDLRPWFLPEPPLRSTLSPLKVAAGQAAVDEGSISLEAAAGGP